MELWIPVNNSRKQFVFITSAKNLNDLIDGFTINSNIMEDKLGKNGLPPFVEIRLAVFL